MTTTSLRSVSLLSACLFAQLGLQFLYQLQLARWFGAGVEMDAFQAVLAIPLVLSTILVGSLQYAFVPQFVRRREQLGEQGAWDLANSTGSVLVPGVTLVCLAGMLAAGWIVPLLFPDFPAETASLSVRLLRIMIWLTWTICVTAYLQTLHQAVQQYRATAIAPVIGTLVTFVSSAVLYSRGGIEAVAWCALLGGLVTTAWQFPLWGRHWRWRLAWDQELSALWHGLWPIWLGAGVYKLDPLVDRYVASGAPTGSVSQLGYAGRLIAALLTLTTNGLAMVVFPVLSQLATAGRFEDLRRELQRAVQWLICLLLPISAALVWFGIPLVRDLFERGRFTSHDTLIVGGLLACHLGVLIGGSFGEILSKTIYALRDTRTPTVIRTAGFAVGLVLKIWWGWSYGLMGLVWGASVSQLLVSMLDAVMVSLRVGWPLQREVWLTLVRCGVATVVSLSIAGLIWNWSFPGISLLAAGVSATGYLLLLAALREESAVRIVNAVLRRH